MAKRTYKISKGQQYDRDGAHVTFGRHESLNARYDHDGKFMNGEFPGVDDREAVEQAVAEVIRTGDPLTLVLGEDVKGNISVADVDRHLERMNRMMDSGDSVY